MNTPEEDLDTSASLESLQTKKEREVLDIVAQLRKCGLESVLSLPQLVVCGEQSAGKSSVLEALTKIPFPRNDNLCTRFATEIILHRATSNSLTIKVIPDSDRPAGEQESIKSFAESITNFGELPRVMADAMVVMGIDNTAKSDSSTLPKSQTFQNDPGIRSRKMRQGRRHRPLQRQRALPHVKTLQKLLKVPRQKWVFRMRTCGGRALVEHNTIQQHLGHRRAIRIASPDFSQSTRGGSFDRISWCSP